MNTDLKIEQVKNELINIVNSSDLPAGVMWYIINDISQQLKEIYNYNINNPSESNLPPSEEETDVETKESDEE